MNERMKEQIAYLWMMCVYVYIYIYIYNSYHPSLSSRRNPISDHLDVLIRFLVPSHSIPHKDPDIYIIYIIYIER